MGDRPRHVQSSWKGEGRYGDARTENGAEDEVEVLDRVVGVEPDGAARIERTLRRLRRRSWSQGGPDRAYDVTFDTQVPGSGQGETFTLGGERERALVGKPVELMLDAWGRLRTMCGRRPDRIESEWIPLRPGDVVSHESIRLASLHELPRQPLAVGESFTETHQAKRNFKPLQVVLKVTLTGIEAREGRRVAVLEVTRAEPPPVEDDGFVVRGRREVDLETGAELGRTLEIDELLDFPGGLRLGHWVRSAQRSAPAPR